MFNNAIILDKFRRTQQALYDNFLYSQTQILFLIFIFSSTGADNRKKIQHEDALESPTRDFLSLAKEAKRGKITFC